MRKDWDLKPGSRTGREWGAFNHVVLVTGDQLRPWSTLRPSPGTSSPPAVRPSSASSLTICGLQTPSPLCSSQVGGGRQPSGEGQWALGWPLTPNLWPTASWWIMNNNWARSAQAKDSRALPASSWSVRTGQLHSAQDQDAVTSVTGARLSASQSQLVESLTAQGSETGLLASSFFL